MYYWMRQINKQTKLHLGLDALSNQKILKGVYYLPTVPILSLIRSKSYNVHKAFFTGELKVSSISAVK